MDVATFQRAKSTIDQLKIEQARITERRQQHDAAYQQKNQECQQRFGCSLEELTSRMAQIQQTLTKEEQELTVSANRLRGILDGLR